MKKISYGILVHNETDSLKKLLDSLIVKRDYEYEIVIIHDTTGNVIDTQNILTLYDEKNNIIVYNRELNNDFASQKNYMTQMCSGDYIVNPDSDEIFPEYLLENVHLIIEQNGAECIWLPRINIVDGLTTEWAQRFGFRIFPDVSRAATPIQEKIIDTESDEYKLLKKTGLIIEETPILKKNYLRDFLMKVKILYYAPVLQYPDYQQRIYRNDYPRIHWKNKVHERLDGYITHSRLPDNLELSEHLAIKHVKSLDKQILQNKKYSDIMIGKLNG